MIALGEPLPEPLVAEPESARPAGTDSIVTPRSDWQLVTGRTRGLFGATDSVAVLLNQSQEVTGVRLLFPGADAFEVLDARLRGVYGEGGWSDAVRSSFANRITLLRLHRRASGGAEIFLFGQENE